MPESDPRIEVDIQSTSREEIVSIPKKISQKTIQ